MKLLRIQKALMWIPFFNIVNWFLWGFWAIKHKPPKRYSVVFSTLCFWMLVNLPFFLISRYCSFTEAVNAIITWATFYLSGIVLSLIVIGNESDYYKNQQ